jgi:predicted CXXCH cytochrome family protein
MNSKATYFITILLLLVVATTIMVIASPTQTVTAAPATQSGDPETELLDCQSCHQATYDVWQESPHAQGLTCEGCHTAIRSDFTHTQLSSSDQQKACVECHTTDHKVEAIHGQESSIYCTACHNPIEENHPEQLMPTDRSADLCGSCHLQAQYDWQQSLHGELGIACVSCHRQHGTTLRKGDVSTQCATCHGSRVEAFTHSEHGDEGLSCADCHLADHNGRMSQTTTSNHSFIVTVDVCVSCHSYQLHDEKTAAVPGPDAGLPPGNTLDSMNSRVDTPVSETPPAVNDQGLLTTALLLTFAALLIAGSMVLPTLGKHNLLKRS